MDPDIGEELEGWASYLELNHPLFISDLDAMRRQYQEGTISWDEFRLRKSDLVQFHRERHLKSFEDFLESESNRRDVFNV